MLLQNSYKYVKDCTTGYIYWILNCMAQLSYALNKPTGLLLCNAFLKTFSSLIKNAFFKSQGKCAHTETVLRFNSLFTFLYLLNIWLLRKPDKTDFQKPFTKLTTSSHPQPPWLSFFLGNIWQKSKWAKIFPQAISKIEKVLLLIQDQLGLLQKWLWAEQIIWGFSLHGMEHPEAGSGRLLKKFAFGSCIFFIRSLVSKEKTWITTCSCHGSFKTGRLMHIV